MILNHLFVNIANILMIRNNLLNKVSVQDVLGCKIKNDIIELLLKIFLNMYFFNKYSYNSQHNFIF
jgi:hypothetical protein